ncbi:MAG: hypothetical protein JHC95_05085 [Solirubrobacteraceae bacterium]|nr:hypothetical protein [Solirubrobacteraceae bacterium]
MLLRRIAPLVIAALVVLTLPAAGHAAGKQFKINTHHGTSKTTFRVAFKPKRSYDYYEVRMDWRGGKAKGCDKYASRTVVDNRRGAWSVVRLKPNTPRGNHRWCKGRWTVRVLRIHNYEVGDACGGDEICRDPAVDGTERITERKTHVRVW